MRALKDHALRRAFARFDDVDVRGGTATRARRFALSSSAKSGGSRPTRSSARCITSTAAAPGPSGRLRCATGKPGRSRPRESALDGEIRYRSYLQWIADEQWRAARDAAGDVVIFGDLPFMVALDSADVWARQGEFRLDVSLGVPPDAFSDTGQDWNLPVYRWDVMERGGFEWLTARARRNADLFDGYRVDHVVGFFRTFFREPGGAFGFTPAEEAAQVALGEHVLRVFLASGATIVAEDLGVVPDFVRAAMTRLGVPGCKVFRWQRHWQQPGHPARYNTWLSGVRMKSADMIRRIQKGDARFESTGAAVVVVAAAGYGIWTAVWGLGGRIGWWLVPVAALSLIAALRIIPARLHVDDRRRVMRLGAFRTYLKDFSDLPNAPALAVVIWDRYLEWAVALNVADEVEKQVTALVPVETLRSPIPGGPSGLAGINAWRSFQAATPAIVVSSMASVSRSTTGGSGSSSSSSGFSSGGFSGGGGGGGGGTGGGAG